MDNLAKCVGRLLLLCTVMWPEVSCATARHALVLSSPVQPKAAKSILDLPIQQIDIHGFRMTEALREIAEAVRLRSRGKLHFDFAVKYARAIEYANRDMDASKWRLRDPTVRISMSQTTLREVVDALCQQAGWSYEVVPPIMFIDDRSYFNNSNDRNRKKRR